MSQWSASLICSNLLQLTSELQALQEGGVEYLHVDVMDGLFVPRLGMYPEMVAAIRGASSLPVEVHLMLQNPEPYIPLFAQAGASIITVHAEACGTNLARVLEQIKNLGLQASVGLNPGTELQGFDYLKEMIDFLLLMGIHPGILGQTIKPYIYEKIRKYKALITREEKEIEIIIDGGVNFGNALQLYAEGADILVGGSQTIFHPQGTIRENLAHLKKREFCAN